MIDNVYFGLRKKELAKSVKLIAESGMIFFRIKLEFVLARTLAKSKALWLYGTQTL